MSSPPRVSEPAPPDLTPSPPDRQPLELPIYNAHTENESENILKATEKSPEKTFVAEETSKVAIKNQYVDNKELDTQQKTTPKQSKRPVSYPCGPEYDDTGVPEFNVRKRYSDPPKPVTVGNSSRSKAQVKPFTKESLERLERKTVQLVREYGFQPKRKLSVEDGSRLPSKYEPFPPALYGRPLEEIDNFIYDEVSCLI